MVCYSLYKHKYKDNIFLYYSFKFVCLYIFSRTLDCTNRTELKVICNPLISSHQYKIEANVKKTYKPVGWIGNEDFTFSNQKNSFFTPIYYDWKTIEVELKLNSINHTSLIPLTQSVFATPTTVKTTKPLNKKTELADINKNDGFNDMILEIGTQTFYVNKSVRNIVL